jgi:hypothetical protein
MAKRPIEQNGQRPNSSLRVLFVELNGSDTTIEEALRTVERMRRTGENGQQANKRIANLATVADGQNGVDESIPPVTSQPGDDLVPGGNGETEIVPLETERPKRPPGPKRDRNSGIELVGSLNFVPEGKTALKTFFSEKSPLSDMDQVLVLCHYLQHVLQSPTFGPGHILTGFRHVGKPVPTDLRQTIRNIKKEKAWLNFTDPENIRMTTEGDNRVEHELGKSGSKVKGES